MVLASPEAVAYGCLEAEHVTHPVPSQSIPSLSLYQIGSAVHLLAVGLPLMVVSLARFLVIVPLAVFEGGVSLVGLRRGFLAWYGTVLAGAAAMARLGWDWLVRRRPLRQGQRPGVQAVQALPVGRHAAGRLRGAPGLAAVAGGGRDDDPAHLIFVRAVLLRYRCDAAVTTA